MNDAAAIRDRANLLFCTSEGIDFANDLYKGAAEALWIAVVTNEMLRAGCGPSRGLQDLRDQARRTVLATLTG